MSTNKIKGDWEGDHLMSEWKKTSNLLIVTMLSSACNFGDFHFAFLSVSLYFELWYRQTSHSFWLIICKMKSSFCYLLNLLNVCLFFYSGNTTAPTICTRFGFVSAFWDYFVKQLKKQLLFIAVNCTHDIVVILCLCACFCLTQQTWNIPIKH